MVYLEVPSSQVVLLQAFFDLYEAIGVVRTLDLSRSLLCIVTTPSMLDDCLDVLDSLKNMIQWRLVGPPPGPLKERFLGYGKKGL